MALIAGDDGTLVLKQRIERSLRDGDLTVVKDHHAKVFNGAGGFLECRFRRCRVLSCAGCFDNQLCPAERKVCRIPEIEGAFNHTSSFPMRIKCPSLSTLMGMHVSLIISSLMPRSCLLARENSFSLTMLILHILKSKSWEKISDTIMMLAKPKKK